MNNRNRRAKKLKATYNLELRENRIPKKKQNLSLTCDLGLLLCIDLDASYSNLYEHGVQGRIWA